MAHITKNKTIRQFNNTYSSYRQSCIIPDLYKFAIASFVYNKLSLVEGDGVGRGVINISDIASFAVIIIILQI